MAGIYIHIPFCKQACHYCDFHFSTNLSLHLPIMESISHEMVLRKTELGGEQIDTIYLGGGTPSIIPVSLLQQLFDTLHKHYSINPEAEVTLECNPDDLTLNFIRQLKNTPINRLSIGIQTFNDQLLQFLNRAHTGKEATESVLLAQDSGLDNLSLDLIYGIHGSDKSIFESDLSTLISLDPTHISAYCLTIETGTAFGKWLETGKIEAVDEQTTIEQYTFLKQTLHTHQFEQYEISNFAKAGFESKHNSSYWKGIPYLGFGPSAHSYNIHSRGYNIAHNPKYIKALENGDLPVEWEELSLKDKINDHILTRLRTKWGIALSQLTDLGYNLRQEKNAFLKQKIADGWLILHEEKLLLSDQGQLFADEIAMELMID